MLSTRELWNVIAGRSSLVEPISVGEELDSCKSFLKEGLNYYKKTNSTSESKVKSTNAVKRKDFILKLSKILDLDEWQTYELFQNYLRIDFRGSGPQLQAILKHEVQLEGFILRVLDFYFKERLYLLKCIKYLVSYWQDDTCLYSEQFSQIVNRYASEDFIIKLIQTLDANFKQLPKHDGIKGNMHMQTEFTTQYIQEQNEMAEIIFLYYKDFEMPVEVFHTLANLFRCRHFGKSQVTRKYINKHAEALTERFGYISSLILLEGLDLELLRKSFSTEEQVHVNEHHLLVNDRWKKIDELLYSWDDVEQQGPVLMGWTIFRHICLSSDNQQLTNLFGDSAMKCNLMEYLQSILLCPLFQKENDPLGGFVKTVVYILTSLVLKIYQEDTLGNSQLISSIISNVLNGPNLTEVFLLQDQSGGVAIHIKSAQKLFPYLVEPYLHMLTSLCTNADSVSIVYDLIEHQSYLTELFGKNHVSDVEMVGENTWKRNTSRLLLKYFHEKLVLPKDIQGKLLQYKKDHRLVCWDHSFSGWIYLLLQLHTISDNLMTFFTDGGEDGALVATTTINLVTAILKQDLSRMNEFEQFIVLSFKLIVRCCSVQSAPTNLITACLKCIQVVTRELPNEMWDQLMESGFLPSHRSVLDGAMTNSHTLSPGSYGVILNAHEIPTRCFDVTKEYLGFIHEFIKSVYFADPDVQSNTNLKKISCDLTVNIVFILKEIFPSFGRWRYTNVCDKGDIGLKCLEIFHLLLTSSHTRHHMDNNRSNLSLKEHVMEALSYQQAGEALLTIISIGVDAVENMTEMHDGETPNVIQLVKLSFAVLHSMFTNENNKAFDEITPLELSLSQQYIQQPSELDFIQTTCKETFLAVITKYIYHRTDPKLPILAILVLRSLAKTFPMGLTASFGTSLIGICNAFVNKLNSLVQPIRLKIVIIEFLTTCIVTQPGIIETFSQINKDKTTGSYAIGKFSCLTPIFEILVDNKHQDVLTATALEFMAGLWLNRYDLAMTVMKARLKDFWDVICHPLKVLDTLKESKLLVNIARHVLDIITVEVYYIRDEKLSEEVIKSLKTFTNGKLYGQIWKLLLPSENTDYGTSQVLLIKSWSKYLSVMHKFQISTCGLDSKENVVNIFENGLDLLNQWLSCQHAHQQLRKDMLVEISSLCFLICQKWRRFVNTSETLLPTINNLLLELSSTNEELLRLLLVHLYSIVLIQLNEGHHGTNSNRDGALLSLSRLICSLTQYQILAMENKDDESKDFYQTSLLSVNLLNEICSNLSEESQEKFLLILKEHGTVHNLLNTLNSSLQKRSDIEFIEATLAMLLKFSRKVKIAEHLSSCGIGKFLCLSIEMLHQWKHSDGVTRIWSMVMGITAHLLKHLQYTFVQQSIDFIGTHKEVILKGMNVIDQLANGNNLLLSEKISIFLYEVATYQTEIVFALPEVLQTIKDNVVQMVRITTALLARQKILSHLLECKAGENIEHLITRTKTPSPTSFRSDSSKSVPNDVTQRLTPNAEEAQNRLINILCNSVATMRKLTPSVVESILDEGMDIDSFCPLVDLNFSSPSLELNVTPSFGTLVSSLNVSFKMIQKMGQSESDRTTPEKDYCYTATPDNDKRRTQLWFLIDNVLIVLISQASCYLRHPKVDEREKQFLKRELGSELSNFIYALRLRMRRGIPASPISSEKLSAASYRRSPSKLSISFTEDDENSILKLADTFTKTSLK